MGSKKPIPLFAEQSTAPTVNKAEKPQKAKLLPEQELAQLENDPKLELLLDRLDEGETLSPQEQRFVDKSLDRIEELMDILGYEYDEDEQDENKDDIMKLLKQ